MFQCEFCSETFSNNYTLNIHIKTAKYCLKLRGKNLEENFTCEACNKNFNLKYNFTQHKSTCKYIKEYEKIKLNENYYELEQKASKNEQLEKQNNTLRENVDQLQKEINKLKEDLEQSQYKNLNYISDLTTVKAENNILQNKVYQNEKMIKLLEQQIEKYENKITKLENELQVNTRELINSKINSEDTLKNTVNQLIKKSLTKTII